MRIRLLAVGTRGPAWVQQGFTEYAKRFPPQVRLELEEVSAARRGGGQSPQRHCHDEGRKMLALVRRSRVVALDAAGDQPDTRGVARWLRDWMSEGQDVALLIGGADGLSSECLTAAERRWSLSRLTLPHMLVRILVAEQLYRAWSLTIGHPYHRGD